MNKIVAQAVSTKTASQAIKSHKFDIADVVNSDWQAVKNVMDKNAKMNNKSLRQAIAYAMNINQVEKRYTQGLTFRVPTLIPAQFGDYFDKNAKGFPYNLKKANQLLDKAGYKKKGKWRVQPNGKPLSIHLAAMTGSAVQEPIIQNYIQQWHKIGLHVSLTGGRLIEFNSFYDKLDHDDKNVDMFMAAWSLSSELSPRGMYSETNPMTNSYSIQAVNNKIVNYSLKPAAANSVWYKIGYAK